ncbi:MAG: DUF3159 domain-containing protein [Candidatus Nanopelagicales bacterium]
MTQGPDSGAGTDPIEGTIEERLEELREDSPAERKLLTKAIGGWRGIVDSGLPSAVFVTVYSFNGQALAPAVWSAVAVGALIALLRLIRREDLTQIAGGFAGILVSAFVASRTGEAEDFFLPGLLVNLAYGSAALLSVLVGWPLLGFLLGGMGGSFTGWRADKQLRRTYAAATWIWVGVFGLRLLVQVPLYLAGQAAALGVVKIVMGWPLFLLGAWLTFLVVRPTLASRRAAERASAPTGGEAAASADDQESSEDSSTSSSPS